MLFSSCFIIISFYSYLMNLFYIIRVYVHHPYTPLQICDTYPSYLYMPVGVTTPILLGSARFRSRGRLPTLSYLHCSNMVSVSFLLLLLPLPLPLLHLLLILLLLLFLLIHSPSPLLLTLTPLNPTTRRRCVAAVNPWQGSVRAV